MISRMTLALAAAATIASGAVAAPAAHAATAQPYCWGKTARCLAATPAAQPPPTHYHAPPNPAYQAPAQQPPTHYHVGPSYQAQPGNEWGDPPAAASTSAQPDSSGWHET